MNKLCIKKHLKKLLSGIIGAALGISLLSAEAFAGAATKNYTYGNYTCAHNANMSISTISGSARVRNTAAGNAYISVRITGYAYDYSGQIIDGYENSDGRYTNDLTISGSKNYTGNGYYTYATVAFCGSGTKGQTVYR